MRRNVFDGWRNQAFYTLDNGRGGNCAMGHINRVVKSQYYSKVINLVAERIREEDPSCVGFITANDVKKHPPNWFRSLHVRVPVEWFK